MSGHDDVPIRSTSSTRSGKQAHLQPVESSARTRPPRAGTALLAWLALGLAAPVIALLGLAPVAVGAWVGRRLGDAAWLGLPGRRRVALANLARAFGSERSEAERRRIARDSFRHLGVMAVESCRFLCRAPVHTLARIDVVGLEHVRAAAAEGRGVLLLTAHLGNWELLTAAHMGTGLALSVVVRPLDHPVLNRLVDRLRLRAGVELVGKQRGLRGILEALRRGRLVGILLDQNAARAEGVFVPFFGIPASTSRALAVIALRTGAPVVPAFIRRQPDGRHLVEVGPRISPPPDGDVAAFTAAFNQAIETAIRKSPEQWFWIHRRWRTRPPGESRG